MKLLAYYDEDNNGKAHYVNVSKMVYRAVLFDFLEKTRIELVRSMQRQFYQLRPSHRRLRNTYRYLLEKL